VNESERFAELWNDYLEGELQESQFEELQQLLQNHSELRIEARKSYQLHRMLGLLVGPSATNQFVEETMKRIPVESQRFVENVLRRIESLDSPSRSTSEPFKRISTERFGWLVALAASIVFIVWFVWDRKSIGPKSEVLEIGATPGEVRFASTARAKFLGEFSPLSGTVVSSQRDYILTSGSVQLQFPTGAQAILEAPAVFQVLSSEKLHLSVGRCSVHAPKGAEGFAVETPTAMIVDRGTRFAVSVSETAKTELHVIEGAADMYRQSPSDAQSETQGVRLIEKQALSVDGSPERDSISTPFQPDLFQSQLPDRVLSYRATESEMANGGVKDLTSLKVQRGGIAKEYAASELIGCELIWFRCEQILIDDGGNPTRHLASNTPEISDRRLAMSDLGLNTGAINPGGAITPIRTDPEINETRGDRAGTPGFAIRFRQPVVNRAGPDVVFFELQDLPGAPDGDAFHVVPIKYRQGLTPITVRSYDLTLTSPESLKLSPFYLHEFQNAVLSLDVFENGRCKNAGVPMFGSNYRALSVGIDLSSLGYADGESVAEMFFQDAMDDRRYVDPVLILGLP
jgi:hypothetical protein